MLVTATVRINRPVGPVFSFFRDIDRHAGRPGSMVPVYEKLTPGPPGAGTRYREVIRLTPWHRMENVSRIVDLAPDRRLALRYEFGGGRMFGWLRYDFASLPGGTRVVQQQTLRLRGRLRLVEPLVGALFAVQVRRRLAGIKFVLDHSRIGEPDGPLLATDYYVARRRRFLAAMVPDAALQTVLAGEFDPVEIARIQAEVRRRLRGLLPLLPYIGGRRNPGTRSLVGAAYSLALYQALRARGVPLARIAWLHQGVVQQTFDRAPFWRRQTVRLRWRLLSTPPGRRLVTAILRRRAAASRARRYPEDFVFDFVPGDGRAFDFGIDYRACAVHRFFASHRAAEFTRYVCLYDYAHSAFVGSGLERTMTLAEGAPRCDFRFKFGRPPRNRQPTQLSDPLAAGTAR